MTRLDWLIDRTNDFICWMNEQAVKVSIVTAVIALVWMLSAR